jgi:hypothetical protein
MTTEKNALRHFSLFKTITTWNFFHQLAGTISRRFFYIAAGLILWAQAQPAEAWTLTPMKIEKELAPGDTITDVLVVDNSGALDNKRYEVKIVDWSLDDHGDLRYYEPGIVPDSFAKSMVCSPMQFKCGPGERKLVRYTLTVPKDAKPGEHTLGVQVLEVVIPPKDPSTGKINVGVSVKCGFLGALTITCPKGEAKAVEPVGLTLEQVEPASVIKAEDPKAPNDAPKEASKAVANTGPKSQNVVLAVENTANVRARPKWSFVINDDNGKSVYEQKAEEFIVLRESKRLVASQLKAPLKPGKYKVIGKLDQGLPYPVQELEKEIEIR